MYIILVYYCLKRRVLQGELTALPEATTKLGHGVYVFLYHYMFFCTTICIWT
jgi:hypothetical protein